eukprot:CAMPEP_0170489036 /NCGR_PEP_ID=MMETSP0208-20121228/7445_1 /TAXON_ID=197538 /ORGANISM="Strombidium inclinatum, Strain S3" /LENGTH=175 /DNA_ID=CAMNT_0010763791 /DNA_START=4296 /DNA_END=4823 /DNA_ORIENTATION=-
MDGDDFIEVASSFVSGANEARIGQEYGPNSPQPSKVTQQELTSLKQAIIDKRWSYSLLFEAPFFKQDGGLKLYHLLEGIENIMRHQSETNKDSTDMSLFPVFTSTQGPAEDPSLFHELVDVVVSSELATEKKIMIIRDSSLYLFSADRPALEVGPIDIKFIKIIKAYKLSKIEKH